MSVLFGFDAALGPNTLRVRRRETLDAVHASSRDAIDEKGPPPSPEDGCEPVDTFPLNISEPVDKIVCATIQLAQLLTGSCASKAKMINEELYVCIKRQEFPKDPIEEGTSAGYDISPAFSCMGSSPSEDDAPPCKMMRGFRRRT